MERSGSLAALQQVLGHTSITTTQRYARLSDEAVMLEAMRLTARDRLYGGRMGISTDAADPGAAPIF